MLALSRHQSGAYGQTVGLAHLGVVDRGLDAQVEVGGGIEDGITGVVGDTGGEVDEGVDNLALVRVGHVEVHGLVGVEILIGMERLLTLKEQHQLMVIDRDPHAQGLGGLGGGGGGEVGLPGQGSQLGGVQGDRAVGIFGHDAVAARLQLAVLVVLGAACGDGQGLAATQNLFNAVRGGVLGVVGELGRGELHRGDGGSLGFGLGLGEGFGTAHGLDGVGEGGGLVRLVPPVAGSGGQQGQQEQGGGQKADELDSFHDIFSFHGRMGGH